MKESGEIIIQEIVHIIKAQNKKGFSISQNRY